MTAGAAPSATKLRWPGRARLDLPASTECRGCGRRVPLADLKPYRRFYCKECSQMMRTTPKQLAFRFTPEHRRNQRNMLWLLLAILTLFPIWALDEMTSRSEPWAASKDRYVWVAWAIGVGAAATFRLLRPLSNDIQYWGGVLLIVSSVERLALSWIGSRVGAPFMLPPPWFGLANGAAMLICLPIARRIWPSR